jgi:hypothetical protein
MMAAVRDAIIGRFNHPIANEQHWLFVFSAWKRSSCRYPSPWLQSWQYHHRLWRHWAPHWLGFVKANINNGWEGRNSQTCSTNCACQGLCHMWPSLLIWHSSGYLAIYVRYVNYNEGRLCIRLQGRSWINSLHLAVGGYNVFEVFQFHASSWVHTGCSWSSAILQPKLYHQARFFERQKYLPIGQVSQLTASWQSPETASWAVFCSLHSRSWRRRKKHCQFSACQSWWVGSTNSPGTCFVVHSVLGIHE